MGRIRVSTTIAATPEQVWSHIEDVGSHVDWMADAEKIEFTSDQRQGVGTAFDCTTRIGPITLIDKMEITEWTDARRMGVRHVGVVTGTGALHLAPTPDGRTLFTWDETLIYPWWLGARIGGVVGDQIMRRVWRANLGRLRHLVEADT